MKILFLAPQPFYQERGTPIAVGLSVRSLCELGHSVDLLVFHEGADFACPGLRLHRIPRVPFVRNVRPGFSVKKLACDAVMFFKAVGLARRLRPDIVHAVEESVFMALVIRRFLGIPYIYDMDSSLPDQIVEKFPRASFLLPVLRGLMAPAIASALMIAPVCEAVVAGLAQVPSERVVVLRDASLLDQESEDGRRSRHPTPS
jgi:hypothetical protein